MSVVWERNPESRGESAIRPYSGVVTELTPSDMDYFYKKYEIGPCISNGLIQRAETRYRLPIFDSVCRIRGSVLRKGWEGSPLEGMHSYGPKADTYKSIAGQPLQSWYRNSHDRLILVEDQLSAIKLYAHGFSAVALLGVPDAKLGGYSGVDRIAEIQRAAPNASIVVALDSDMTETAFLFARKWQHAFKSIRVAILDKDLKDTKAVDFPKVLGL